MRARLDVMTKGDDPSYYAGSPTAWCYTLLDALDAAEAEVERLRGAASDIERLSDTYTAEGTDIVLNRILDLRAERDALAARNTALREAVEARCAQIEAMPIPADPGMSQTEITGRIVATIVKVIRAALAVDGAGQEGRHG